MAPQRSAGTGARSGTAGFGARLVLLGVSLLVALLLLEGAVRVRQWMRYGTTQADAVELVTDPATGLRFARPHMDTGRIQTNSLGFRSPELETPKPRGRVRLAFLGGSTTFCAEVSSNAVTWPSLVMKKLEARYSDVSFDYVNAAEPGYGVASSLKNYRLRVARLTPDFVLYYEASNDFSMDTRDLARRRGLFRDEAESPSSLARISSAWGLIEKNLTYRRRVAESRTGRRLDYDADSLARGFESRLVELIQTARETAPLCALATFSHKVRRDQPPAVQLQACTSSLYDSPYMSVAGLLDGWDAYNRAIAGAARETGAMLITGDETIPGDDLHFADSVHFKDAGSVLQAERIANALIASPEFNRLLASRRGAARAATS
ncbi:MAG: SGNH/GDSL hydrolase family protein [Bacteroidota bacterium]